MRLTILALAGSRLGSAQAPRRLANDADAEACVEYTSAQRANSSLMCGAVTQYPFHLGAGQTLDELNAAAVATVGNADSLDTMRVWYTLSSACLGALKTWACRATHQQCGVDAGCDACPAVVRECDADALEWSGIDVSECSTFSSSPSAECAVGIVGGTFEPYVGGACAGIIVGEMIAIPPRLPLPVPYAVQSQVLEPEVAAAIGNVPSWATAECQLAARKMMCAVHVPTAEVLALPAGASNASTVEVGVPRRVARSVCEAYLTECGGALRRGKDFLDASLYVDACEAWAPMDGQLAKSNVDLHLGSVPSFKARPNEVGNATLAPSELAVDCVYRTTPFPPDRDRRAVNHVHGTGCAFDCPLPLMTKADQTYFDKVKIVADVYVTLTMGFNVLTYTILPEKRQKTPSFLWVSIAIFLEDFFRRWSRYTNWDGIGGERQNFWCADKVTAWVQTDWSSACEIQSVLQLWVLAWRSGIVVGLGLDMYARAVLMSPDPIWYTTHLTLPVSTVLATLVTIGLTWAYPDRGIQTEIGKFRYEFCYYSPEVELGLNIYNTLTQLAAIYFMVRALVAIVSALNAVAAMKAPKLKRQMGHETSEQRGIAATTNKNVSQMYSSNVYMFKVPTIFIIILVGASQQLWRRADYRRVNSAKNIDRYEGWADCLLANSGLTEAMQSRVCGELPKAIYPDLEYHLSVAWFQFPWRVLLLLLFSLNKDSVKCWIQHYPWAGRFLRPLIQKGDIIDLVSTLIVVSLTYISSAMTSPFVKKTLSPIHAARTLSPFKGGHFFKGAKINACDGDTIALDVPSLSDGEIPGSR